MVITNVGKGWMGAKGCCDVFFFCGRLTNFFCICWFGGGNPVSGLSKSKSKNSSAAILIRSRGSRVEDGGSRVGVPETCVWSDCSAKFATIPVVLFQLLGIRVCHGLLFCRSGSVGYLPLLRVVWE